MFSKDREAMRLKTKEVANLYSAATGIETDINSLLLAAERIINIERAFGCREGLRKKDDEMPRRFIEEEIPKGPMKGKRYDISDEFIEEYYKQRGWDETGIPRRDRLAALDLGEICFDLKQIS
jgi:aldehyde:ferredoxin oxidoreductase